MRKWIKKLAKWKSCNHFNEFSASEKRSHLQTKIFEKHNFSPQIPISSSKLYGIYKKKEGKDSTMRPANENYIKANQSQSIRGWLKLPARGYRICLAHCKPAVKTILTPIDEKRDKRYGARWMHSRHYKGMSVCVSKNLPASEPLPWPLLWRRAIFEKSRRVDTFSLGQSAIPSRLTIIL